MIVSLPNEQCLRQVMSRSVIVRSGFELWARSKQVEKLHEQMKCLPEEVTSKYFGVEKSFKMVVETFNKVITQDEKIDKIEVIVPLWFESHLNIQFVHLLISDIQLSTSLRASGDEEP